jgi:hypothetical protein
MDNEHRRFNTLMGLALIGGGITGVASLVIALLQFLQSDFGTVGLCLIAAAMSFGLLANALLHN